MIATEQAHFTTPQNANSTINFENWIYLTQCVQTLCIKAESEHYRRGKGESANTMGAIYWYVPSRPCYCLIRLDPTCSDLIRTIVCSATRQLNDIWQAPSWSSIEYGNRWKILHYAAAKFFSPTLISSFEYPSSSASNSTTYSVHVTSDVNAKQTGSWQIRAISWSTGSTLRVWSDVLTLLPLESKAVYSNTTDAMLQGIGTRDTVLFITSWQGTAVGVPKESTSSYNYHYLTSMANVALPKATIMINNVVMGASQQEASFTVTATAMAPFVWLQTSLPGRFSYVMRSSLLFGPLLYAMACWYSRLVLVSL
jgi:beta-mannosidase